MHLSQGCAQCSVLLLLVQVWPSSLSPQAPPRTPTSAARALVGGPELWESFVTRFSDVLRRQWFEAAHFICRAGDRCATDHILRAFNEGLVLTYTSALSGTALGNLTSLPPRNVIFVVDLDLIACEIVQSRFLHAAPDILVVILSFRPLAAFLAEMSAGFDACWRREMLNVVAAVSTPRQTEDASPAVQALQALPLYTFHPYFPDNCRDMRPRFIRNWTLASTFGLEELGLDRRLQNLNRCVLRVVTFAMRPFINPVPNNGSSRYTILGVYNRLTYEIERRLNFTAVFSLPSDNLNWGYMDQYPVFGGLLGDLFHNRSDVGLTYSTNDVVTLHFDRPFTALVSCTTWCLPTGHNPYPLWRPLVDEFDKHTWAGLLLACLVATLVLRLLMPRRRRRLTDAAFTALRALVSGVQPGPRGHPLRAFLFCWYFFGVVVSTLYVAALHSISTTDTSATEFRSLRELANSDLPLYILEQQATTHIRNTTNEDEERIAKRVLPFTVKELNVPYTRLLVRRDIGVGTDRNACRFYAQQYTPPGQRPRFHVLDNYCLVLGAANNLMLKKGHHLVRPLARLLARLDEGGLSGFWFSPGKFRDSASFDPTLRLRQVQPFLALLLVGLVAATATFVAELLWYYVSCDDPRRREALAADNDHPRQPAVMVVDTLAKQKRRGSPSLRVRRLRLGHL